MVERPPGPSRRGVLIALVAPAAPGTPWRVPVRDTVKPCSINQPASVSAPRFLPTTRWATPVGVSRGSQVSSSSCSAALPIRIGGLDQSWSYLVSAGT